MIKKQHSPNLPPHTFGTTNSVVDSDTGVALEYKDLKLGPHAKEWTTGTSNEMSRLAQGVKTHILTDSNTIYFIHPSQIPSGRWITFLTTRWVN